MKAICWFGKHDIRVEDVPEPSILSRGDIIVKISSTAICGSDLHLYNNYVPTMEEGDILGHEFMGEVVEVGKGVKRFRTGDRVVVPFTISCGHCTYCSRQLHALCDNTNPNAWMAEEMAGFTGAAIFGYSHLYGGYAGGQAEYARVPFADAIPIKIESDLPDEKLLLLSEVFPTGYMAVEVCNIRPGNIVAIWGCGPVGQFAIRSAFLLGAHKVIAIDGEEERLEMAAEAGAITISSDDAVLEMLKELTGGRGPDACIDAVGMEAHGSLYDAVKQKLMLETDRPYVLRQAIRACRKGGVISIPGVYSGAEDKIPFGAAFAKGITIKTGQTHVQKYMPALLKAIERGDIDPSFVVTHELALEDGPKGYEMFASKTDGCVKVVMKPELQPDRLGEAAGRDRLARPVEIEAARSQRFHEAEQQTRAE